MCAYLHMHIYIVSDRSFSNNFSIISPPGLASSFPHHWNFSKGASFSNNFGSKKHPKSSLQFEIFQFARLISEKIEIRDRFTCTQCSGAFFRWVVSYRLGLLEKLLEKLALFEKFQSCRTLQWCLENWWSPELLHRPTDPQPGHKSCNRAKIWRD